MLDEFIENEFQIDEDASAFSVLKKILHDGFIHSSWSIRNRTPSVYGPNSAVCFTEMPLYALVDYARGRGEKSGYVGNYGIAFRRNELYAAIKISSKDLPMVCFVVTQHSESALSLCLRYSKTSCL